MCAKNYDPYTGKPISIAGRALKNFELVLRFFALGLEIVAAWLFVAVLWLAVYVLGRYGTGCFPVWWPAVLAVAAPAVLLGITGCIPGIGSSLTRRARKNRRRALIGGVVVVLLASGAVPPLWQPAEKLSPEATLPVVYSAGYNISVFGIERKAAADVHRYEKIYNYLVSAGVVDRKTVVVPREVTDGELMLVHDKEWVNDYGNPETVGEVFGMHIIGSLPRALVDSRLVRPFRLQTRGTVLAARYALERGIACNLGGGLAHAQRDHGEGFNLFADVPLAIAQLRKSGWRGRAMILDVDAHHGQGNAKFFIDDPTVYVADVYNPDIYPSEKVHVDLAIKVPSQTDDKTYLAKLKAKLPGTLEGFKPDLVIYIAGVDCYEGDLLGGLAMTEQGMFERDRFVIDQCTQRGIPLCITLSGGYWKDSWRPSARMFAYAAKKLKK